MERVSPENGTVWSSVTAVVTPVVALALAALLPALPARAQLVQNLPASLKTVPTPEPANLNQFLNADGQGKITDAARAAAIALGKALFWDQAAGSDGQACASCHFSAGADSRTRNQLDPGLRAIPPQTTWGATPPQQVGGTAPQFYPGGYALGASDFPLTRFVVPGDRSSGIASDTQAVVSSQGVVNSSFGDVTPAACPGDQTFVGKICDTRTVDATGNGALFDAAQGWRNVEPRNTPSVVNAIFNHRNFWDSRARNEFNGVNPIGELDPYARVLILTSSSTGTKLQKVALNDGTLVQGTFVPNPFGPLRLEDASLASQAVGPALSDMEMSSENRSFAKLGKKVLALPMALAAQLVHPADGVLGNNKLANVKSNYPSKGINRTYADLVKAAFQPRWWNAPYMVELTGTTDPDGTVGLRISKLPKTLTTSQYTQMEFNFSLFWGLAIQLYEATLRADDSPFDRAFDLGNPLTVRIPAGCDDVTTPCLWGPKQAQGWTVFQGGGKCIGCHGGPELTNASVRNVRLVDGRMESMSMGDLRFAAYDVGWYDTAVRRCLDQSGGPAPCDDGGAGVTIGPLALPLSYSRFALLVASHDPTNAADPITAVCSNQPEACNIAPLGGRVAVDGAFKTPGLRDVELTAPYMHNGGQLSLMDTVSFYDRGGDFPEYDIQDLDPDMGTITCSATGTDPTTGEVFCPTQNLVYLPLGLSQGDKDALVAFMIALTDERVRMQRAPFDHPQLFVPNLPVDPGCPSCRPGELPAVGQLGSDTYGDPAHPLPTFSQNLAP